jgi:hypothetical protein
VKVIWGVPWPAVIVPFAIVHVKTDPKGNRRLAVRFGEKAPTISGATITGGGGGGGGVKRMFTLALAVLLLPSGSGGDAAVTPAVFNTIVPGDVLQGTSASSVMVAVAPDARLGNVTVRALPAPPQTPLPEAEHDRKASSGGRLSVTTTLAAASEPRFETVKMKEMVEPVKPFAGADMASARSAEGEPAKAADWPGNPRR